MRTKYSNYTNQEFIDILRGNTQDELLLEAAERLDVGMDQNVDLRGVDPKIIRYVEPLVGTQLELFPE